VRTCHSRRNDNALSFSNVNQVVVFLLERCVYNEQNNTWLFGDTEFLFLCCTQYLTPWLRPFVRCRVPQANISQSWFCKMCANYPGIRDRSFMRKGWGLVGFGGSIPKKIREGEHVTFFSKTLKWHNVLINWNLKETRTTTWNLPGTSETRDCINIIIFMQSRVPLGHSARFTSTSRSPCGTFF